MPARYKREYYGDANPLFVADIQLSHLEPGFGLSPRHASDPLAFDGVFLLTVGLPWFVAEQP